jgi:hypothetical protein
MRWGIAIGVLGFAAWGGSAAHGQAYGGNPAYGGYMPPATFQPNTIYNRQTQPLSPYLNLFRGNNPAVNYYYGVRPGTPAGGWLGPTGGPAAMMPRFTFFPNAEPLASPEETEDGQRGGIPPTGHMTGFNNTMGYLGGLPGPAMNTLQGAGGTSRQAPMAAAGGHGGAKTATPPRH